MDKFLSINATQWKSCCRAFLAGVCYRYLPRLRKKNSGSADVGKSKQIACVLWKRLWKAKSGLGHVARKQQKEQRAFACLLQRSGFMHTRTPSPLYALTILRRSFCTSGRRSGNNDGERNKEGRNGKEDDNEKNDDNDPEMSLMEYMFLLAFNLLGVLGFILLIQMFGNREDRYLSWNEFFNGLLCKGLVEEVQLSSNPPDVVLVKIHKDARNLMFPQEYLLMKVPSPHIFEEKLRAAEDELGIAASDRLKILPPQSLESQEGVISPFLLFGSLLLLFTLVQARRISAVNKTSAASSKRKNLDIFGGLQRARYTRGDQKTKIKFKDVAGLKEAKVEVMEFVDYLKNPKRFQELGAKIPKGALLLGPPGCGKTLLARALANESGVPFLATAGSEFIEMIGGLGASRIRDLFNEAKDKAPCIIYIDEIDSIGRKRASKVTTGSHDEEGQTLNQLLTEMDGMETNKEIIVLASTNRADVLDNALTRAGRFDRRILIDFPTMIEREELFELYLNKLVLADPVKSLSPRLAQLTPGMSGADIANICNEAALVAARDMKTKVEAIDFEYAVERVVAGVAKKSRVLTPGEKKILAYHEAGHAIVSWMLEHTDQLLKISIVPRTSAKLGYSQHRPADLKLYSKEMLFERLCVSLGGYVAEAIVFDKTSTGSSDDLERVTKLATKQVKEFGMSERIGLVSFPDQSNEPFSTKPYSNQLAALIDQEVSQLIARASNHTKEVLQKHKDKLHLLANTLLEKESMTYQEIEDLIGAPPFEKTPPPVPHIPTVDVMEEEPQKNENGPEQTS